MSTLTPDQWLALKPYIERALEMSEEDRAALLSSLRTENPELAEHLVSLLDEHNALAKSGFMEQPVAPPPRMTPGLTGQAMGPYTLTSLIGQGGMGSVWLARRSDGDSNARSPSSSSTWHY